MFLGRGGMVGCGLVEKGCLDAGGQRGIRVYGG